MLITDLSIRKVGADDPRHPGMDACKMPDGSIAPFTDLYLLQCKTDDGQELECPFFAMPHAPRGEMTPANTGNMLNWFAAAVAKIGQTSKAA